MVLHRASRKIEHRTFRDILDYLDPRDALVINRTRVLPAKFSARRATGGRIGGLFVREIETGKWEVMLAGLKKIKPNEPLRLASPDGRSGKTWTLTLDRRLDRGLCEISITPAQPAWQVLDIVGTMPLPPYIHRDSEAEDHANTDTLDRDRYQTVFAQMPGAVAAPTAGLHFTPQLMNAVRDKGVAFAEVTLHVGLGTFQPVEVENLAYHNMHSEWYELPADTVSTLIDRRSKGGRTIAVGTTSVRVLESCAQDRELRANTGWTNILIYPPYTFQAVDALITNFHLPGSTLLALIYAFAGTDFARETYRIAIEERYRFFSYGDAMLIL
jgi:S-adenosylmethionine:tRNA ribosyltransferase-isomerase